MKLKPLNAILLIAVLSMSAVFAVQAQTQDALAELRAATAQFHRPEAAQAAGYDLVPGLDHCFDNPGVGGMGYHYINVGILDTTVELSRPEAMVYTPGPDGILQLGAVEYVVPAAAWDAEGHTQLPMLFGRYFHLNEALGVYILHVWVWKNNPSDMFEDWNPNVSCPVSVSLGGGASRRR
jgi:hypothetical protein